MSKYDSWMYPTADGRPYNRPPSGTHLDEEGPLLHFHHTDLDHDSAEHFDVVPAERLHDAEFFNKFDDDFDDSEMIYDVVRRL